MPIATKKQALLLALVVTVFFLIAFNPDPETGSKHGGRAKTQARPALSGPVLTLDTEQFRIHYTLQGEDAVSAQDADENGQPDYVEAVAEAVRFSWQQQVERLGWRAPLPDKGEGGDTRFDVYLENQSNVSDTGDIYYGYVETYGGLVEEATAQTAYGYLSLDNDYSREKFGNDLAPLDSMRTTAAHELHHAIQAAYDDQDPYEWLYEASAVWMEDKLYPEIGDAKNYLTGYMRAPDLCPLSVGRDDQDVRWYGGWILLRYISEHYGGPDTIRHLWNQMADLEGLDALKATLADQQTSLSQVLVDFSIANLTQSNCPIHMPYCYTEGDAYRRPYVEDSVRIRPEETKTLIPKDGVQQFGADYIRLKGKAPIRIDFQGSTAGQWELRLVGLKKDTIRVMPWTRANPVSPPPADFNKLYLIIVNTAPVEWEADCGYHNYTVAFSSGLSTTDQALTAPPVPADPGPYIPPIFGAEHQSHAFFPGQGEPLQAEEIPFPLLYPGYLPSGYDLDQITRYTVTDLGDWAGDYSPGGDPVISLEYTGPSEGSYLSISYAPSPPETLFDWTEEVGYLENDIRLVNNKPVHLTVFRDEAGSFSTATFLHGNLFLVIDGTFGPIETQQVVAGLLANNP
jgi:hypothetical protein